jgi:hypothetical protein
MFIQSHLTVFEKGKMWSLETKTLKLISLKNHNCIISAVPTANEINGNMSN